MSVLIRNDVNNCIFILSKVKVWKYRESINQSISYYCGSLRQSVYNAETTLSTNAFLIFDINISLT